MSEAEAALSAIRTHFETIDSSQYEMEVRKYSPELSQGGPMIEDETLADVGLRGLETSDAPNALVPLRSRPAHTPLDAYLASALTGLNEIQRQLVFHLSDTVGVICGELDIDLYEPRKKTDPVHHQSVADSDVFHIDRERVISSDLLIYLAHHPSTGAGEELDFAYNAMVPIVVVSHSNSRVSRMVTGIPGLVITVNYDEPEELRALLRETLLGLRPQLVQRKLAFSDYDVNIVGDRIRKLRESQGLTRDQLVAATSTRFQISREMLTRLEESTDRTANPSLVVLRELATALKTSVADLVEPDLQEVILTTLTSWVADRQAARFGDMSVRDRNKILRRLLLRLIDNLEQDT